MLKKFSYILHLLNDILNVHILFIKYKYSSDILIRTDPQFPILSQLQSLSTGFIIHFFYRCWFWSSFVLGRHNFQMASNTLVFMIVYDLFFCIRKIPTLYPLCSRPNDYPSRLLMEYVSFHPCSQYRLPINAPLWDNCFHNFILATTSKRYNYESDIKDWNSGRSRDYAREPY
jgi:hypothetical protein